MERIPEPELMDADDQAAAYANADFEEPNQRFVDTFAARFGAPQGWILDLGCGPADIPLRLARGYPDVYVRAVDGAPAMLARAQAARAEEAPAVAARVKLHESILQGLDLSEASYDAVISNSLLHHLHDPAPFWTAVCRFGRPGAGVLIMDLARPEGAAQAQAIVDTYAASEPAVLRQDFYNSLFAAFTVDEVRGQLDDAGLQGLHVAMASDRHWIVSGWLPEG